MTAASLVNFYGLQPHPEGGFYKETYRSAEIIDATALPGRFNADRHLSTAIYFLLERGQFSAFHRIKSDELWHFYSGGPLNIYVIHPDGRSALVRLGSNVEKGEVFQAMVPAGCWFASEPAKNSDYCFVGCTVAPGFDFADFELASREDLARDFPQHGEWISRLCR
jgi:uncharacterized protein